MRRDAERAEGCGACRACRAGTGPKPRKEAGRGVAGPVLREVPTLWLSDQEAKARCIEALRSLHWMNGMKKKSSSNLSMIPSHNFGSHCQVMPPPSPVVSSASSGKLQR